MKKIIGCLWILTFIACSSGDKKNAYIINATIEGAEKGDVVVFRNSVTAKNDTFIVKESNKIIFEGTIKEPTAATIYFPATVEATQSAVTLFLEPGNILVNGKKDKLQNSKVSGGNANKDMQKVVAITNKYAAGMQIIGDSLKKLYDAGKTEQLKNLEQEYLALEEKARNEVEAFIQQSPKSYVAAYFAYELFGYIKEESKLASIYSGFDATIKESHYGKKLKNILDALQSTKVGSIAPNFTLTDINGKLVSLNNFKGKYVLLDFWASWCGPCRMENPNVVDAFNTFKNKNFTIVGVSLDENKQQWLQAIAKDNLTWQHVSDLKGWSSEIAALYSVQSIPANFLIDPNGKIIAKDLRGEALKEALSKIFP